MSELMVCTGPVSYKGIELVQRDLANLRAAVTEAKAEEAFARDRPDKRRRRAEKPILQDGGKNSSRPLPTPCASSIGRS